MAGPGQHQTKSPIKVSNDPAFRKRSTDCKPSGQTSKGSVCFSAPVAIGLDSQGNTVPSTLDHWQCTYTSSVTATAAPARIPASFNKAGVSGEVTVTSHSAGSSLPVHHQNISWARLP